MRRNKWESFVSDRRVKRSSGDTRAHFNQMWLTYAASLTEWRISAAWMLAQVTVNPRDVSVFRTGGEMYVENTAQGRRGHGKPGNIRENIWKGKSHGPFYNKCTFSWLCCTWRNERQIFHFVFLDTNKCNGLNLLIPRTGTNGNVPQ